MPLEGEYAPNPAKRSWEQVELYERTGGKESGTLGGRPIVIVTSRGAKSGKLRKTPLMRTEHDGAYLVAASMGGAPRHRSGTTTSSLTTHVELQDVAEK